MTSITNNTHSLTQVTMSDGTKYDVTVSFLGHNGKPLSLDDFHDYCQLDNSTELKEQLSSLLKAITETHATHAKITSFRDIKVMTLTNQGMAFDQKPLQTHDIDVDKSKINTFTQDAPTRKLLNACHKVSDVWNQASRLIVDDYNHHTQDCIQAEAEVARQEAAAAEFKLTQAYDHQNSFTINTTPTIKEVSSSDDETPAPSSYLSGALTTLGNGAYAVGNAVYNAFATNPIIAHDHEEATNENSSVEDDSTLSTTATDLNWTASLDMNSSEMKKNTALQSAVKAFKANKSNDAATTLKTLFEETYRVSMEGSSDFENFTKALATQYTAINIQEENPPANLAEEFKAAAIAKLEIYFKNLVKEKNKKVGSHWFSSLRGIDAQETQSLKKAYSAAQNHVNTLITGTLKSTWNQGEKDAQFTAIFPL